MNNEFNGMIMQTVSCVLMHFLQIIHENPLFFNKLYDILPLFGVEMGRVTLPYPTLQGKVGLG